MSDNTFPINKWYNRRIPTTLGILIIVLAGSVAGFVIIQVDANLPSGHVSPIFTPRFGEVNDDSDTFDWQTYENEEYGFEIRYPSNWIIEDYAESSSFIHIIPRDFQEDKRDMGLSIAMVDVGRESVFDPGSKTIITDTIFVGKKAKIYICPEKTNCPMQLAYSKSLRLEEYPDSWGDKNEINFDIRKDYEELVPLFEEVLSTFKFIESIDTSDWQTYKNNEYGFEFLHPIQSNIKKIHTDGLLVLKICNLTQSNCDDFHWIEYFTIEDFKKRCNILCNDETALEMPNWGMSCIYKECSILDKQLSYLNKIKNGNISNDFIESLQSKDIWLEIFTTNAMVSLGSIKKTKINDVNGIRIYGFGTQSDSIDGIFYRYLLIDETSIAIINFNPLGYKDPIYDELNKQYYDAQKGGSIEFVNKYFRAGDKDDFDSFGEEFSDRIKLFNQIVSTFKFID